MMKLGVNIDHVATLRQARGTQYPDPTMAALLCEQAGCQSIVAHLREDRRHIQDSDISRLKEALNVPFNLEMSINQEIVEIAIGVKPDQATLVPEKRRELTTEGGLNLSRQYKEVEKAVKQLQSAGIKVSLFIDPIKDQVRLARAMRADLIELNTGKYSESKTNISRKAEIKKLRNASSYAKKLGFLVAAGHGLDYDNVQDIIAIRAIEELNIGHSIICRSVFCGIATAVEDMILLMISR